MGTEEASDDNHTAEENDDHCLHDNEESTSPIEDTKGKTSSNLPFWKICNPFDMLVGLVTVIMSIFIVLTLEMIALAFYMTAALIYKCTKKSLKPVKVITAPFYAALMIFYFIFALSDSIILLFNVMLTEALSMFGWVLGCLF